MNNHGDKHGLKSKTIKSILRRKIDGWLETIDDEILRETCRRGNRHWRLYCIDAPW